MTTLFENIFESYAYSYPHKHSYRRLAPLSLKELWEPEKKDALFLYVHLPFCEMRCGFCNLFTMANPKEDMVNAYLQALEREAVALKQLVEPVGFGQMAVGGGTPTFLELPQLEKLFAIIRRLGAQPENIPVSFEMSPQTITAAKAELLLAQGVSRVSIGIQSFLETEQKALGRPQKNKEAFAALDLLKQYPFGAVNVDLIYGAQGQTVDTWLYSVEEAIRYEVEEVFIYPLYIRPLTGITRSGVLPEDNRPALYQAAKNALITAGYEQVSMRMFRRGKTNAPTTLYSCQEDGMMGLGAGARSYTKAVHYSSEYAVARHNIKSIIDQYALKTTQDFGYADYGIVLSREEQQRRFIIKSILHSTGLDLTRYQALYGSLPADDYPQLQQLQEHGLAIQQDQLLTLTSAGIDYSDAIGPWLYSTGINERINSFALQ
ncbi:coproporphyrinogen III oxidase family protein [Chitinophaga agrisoli]|uniref:Coproporphyrinogen III oxidase family protein n=1 Tax=Chitinophaga agrisoli TaxID=2607653 RepID=A0A5B2VHM1_9BACT|nr:STM4012 family radical SAM protein [Chitinophaga agrisoli]KAA2238414.1 coproporphyrinogen III oxidase family protein [Chitinophaga agrisoli]